MKNSVNGRTFDEIFGQKGKEIEVGEMVEDMVYLLTHGNTHSLCIFVDLYKTGIHVKFQLFEDSQNIFTDGWDVAIEYHEATPDQIALLKSYQK